MNRLNFDIRYAVLILPPYFVFIILNFVLLALSDSTLDLGITEFASHANAQELIGRYRVMAAGIFSISMSIAILIVFAVNLWVGFEPRVWAIAVGAVVVCSVIGYVAQESLPDWADEASITKMVDRPFFHSALAQGHVTACAAGVADCGTWGAAWAHGFFSRPVDALNLIAAPMVLFGMILALAAVPRGAVTTDGLKRAHDILQRYLYLSGLLLSSGMLFMNAWMRWPTKVIADGELQAIYGDLVSSLSLYIGTGFTLMILAAYLPVMLILRARTEEFGRDNVPDASVPAATYTDSIRTVVAILSPILASAVGGFGQGAIFG